jgi:hypothetical protein
MKVAVKINLSQQGIKNQIAKEAKVTREELDVMMLSPRKAREISDLMVQGMRTSFVLEDRKNIFIHAVGLNISLIMFEETNNAAESIDDIPENMIEVLESFEAVVEGSVDYEHMQWTAENVYQRLV